MREAWRVNDAFFPGCLRQGANGPEQRLIEPAVGYFPKSWPAACKRGPETHTGPVLWSEGRPELKLCSPPYRPVSHREITPNLLSPRWA